MQGGHRSPLPPYLLRIINPGVVIRMYLSKRKLVKSLASGRKKQALERL